ncbi:MAG: hypothetical protein CM1200mP2_10730 [Planctomycetaceae bacterium]|nr:MAG: hypothetical protein CM1200mP2_10730 [Planctomycetaceae bacterium]
MKIRHLLTAAVILAITTFWAPGPERQDLVS